MQIESQSNTPQPAPRNENQENVARFREGRVYAVLFSDGWLKVGRGRDAKSRINSHIGTSAMRGAKFVKSISSGLIADSSSAENALIAFCSEKGTSVHGREWFIGVEFDEVKEFFGLHLVADTPERLESAKRAQAKHVNSMLDSVSRCFRPAPVSAQSDVADPDRWIAALTHARILDRIFRDDMYGGWLFEISASGMTNFFNYAALTVNTLDEGEIADLFYGASRHPGEALEQIVSTGQSLVAAYAAEVNK